MAIEVERKFVVREDTGQRLRALGGQCLGAVRLEDRYFDTADYRLTSSNVWLRRRDGRWQLKTPSALPGTPRGPDAQYRETESEEEILSVICPLLGLGSGGEDGKENPRSLEQLLESGPCLLEFAIIITERTSYQLEGRLRVDLDWAEFGHQLGEIEAMVDSEQEIPAALARIQELARKLDLRDGERQLGKMHTYLQRFRPDHFQRLLDAGVL